MVLCFTLDPYNLFFTRILNFSNMLDAFDKFYMQRIEIFFFYESLLVVGDFIPLK